ncbi:uncharacterized protein MICPUCDRAFT_11510, partial [Micromonas pusilla CCMP1545]
EDVKEAFREFDLDKNGYVGAAEISHILQSMGEKATDDEVDEMILMADLDGDGQVSFDEFFKLINSFQGMPPPPGDKVKFAFQVFDLDGSGSIDADELRKIVKATNMASEKQLTRKVEWLMKQCDSDGDGQISFDEFVNLAKK